MPSLVVVSITFCVVFYPIRPITIFCVAMCLRVSSHHHLLRCVLPFAPPPPLSTMCHLVVLSSCCQDYPTEEQIEYDVYDQSTDDEGGLLDDYEDDGEDGVTLN